MLTAVASFPEFPVAADLFCKYVSMGSDVSSRLLVFVKELDDVAILAKLEDVAILAKSEGAAILEKDDKVDDCFDTKVFAEIDDDEEL